MTATAVISRRSVGCVSDLTIDRWLLGETPGSDEARRVEAHMKTCASCASRIGALRGLYSAQVPAAGHQPPVRLAEPPPQTPGQTGALQFVILRDGLLVGTEFFTPGTYLIGSDPRADLQLDGVLPQHARVYFRDGRVAVQAEHGALYVNGFKVDSCEVRSVDEVLVGPYVLRPRVLRERWADARAPIPEVTVVEPVAPPPPGKTRLSVELWWGDSRQDSRSFDGVVMARDLALWGFTSEVVAEPADDGQFVIHAATGRPRVLAPGERFALTAGAMRLVFSVVAAPEAVPAESLISWPTVLLSAALLSTLVGAISVAPVPDEEPFTPRDLKKSVSLIWPAPKPKPVEAPHRAPTSRQPESRTTEPHRASPRPPAPPDRFSAINKLLSGARFKSLLDPAKTSGKPLAGRAPTNLLAGIGASPVKRLELGLSGDGGAAIGASGAKHSGAMSGGGYGRGNVGGLVDRPRASGITLPPGTGGSIDKDAVARAIAEHLAEVSACYEKTLISNGPSGGRLSLEWTITTAGAVSQAKVKSSTLKDASIASCVLARLKTWQFPAARGGAVVVSYPFVFQSSDF